MRVRVGTGPDSFGVWFASDARQMPYERFLDEVVQAGYQWIELGPWGYLPTDLSVLRSELDARGLQVAGNFAMGHLADPEEWPSFRKQIESQSEILSLLGSKVLVLIDDLYSDPCTGEVLRPEQADDEGWKRLIENTHHAAEIARSRGLQLAFHPHADTLIQYEEQIERFLADTDPASVGICLDTGHHSYRGGDPVRFFRQHHDRIRYLHLKSVDRQIQEQVDAEHIPFATAVGMGVFCEPWRGAVDFAAFRDALREFNYDGWATVEQDMFPAPLDKPLPIARQTLAYLQEIGIAA